MCRSSCYDANSDAVSAANSISDDESIPDIEPIADCNAIADAGTVAAANRDTNPRPGRITHGYAAADAIAGP